MQPSVSKVSRAVRSGARNGDPPLAAQPLAVREQESRALEGPASEVRGERVVEAPLRSRLVARQERACVAQVQFDPDCRSRTDGGLHLRQQLSPLGDAVGVEGGLREVGDEPASHDPVVRRIGRVEQPPGGRVCILVPARSQRAEHAAELSEGDGDLAAGGQAQLLGAGGAALGGVGVASHAGDEGEDGLASRDPERSAELGREPPRLLAGGNCDVPRRGERASWAGGPTVPPFAPRRRRTRVTNGDVKGADDERRRPQVPHGLRIKRSRGRHGFQPRQGLGRVADRIGTSVDG
jgi:hypothetical protein